MTVIRIPNLPNGRIVDDNGNATDDEITFRHALISQLQLLFGSEGCVVPTQSYANMIIIQNNQIPNPITGIADQYTCQFGTCLYVPDFPVGGPPPVATPSIVFCVPDGSGNPLFKRVTLI
jgi:hypothetical protein